MTHFIITYGRSDNNELANIIVNSVEEAKSLALKFLAVIPCTDEFNRLTIVINKWKGIKALKFSHQDDDHFIFSANSCQHQR